MTLLIIGIAIGLTLAVALLDQPRPRGYRPTTRGGYPSGTRQVTDLPTPPRGPGGGSR